MNPKNSVLEALNFRISQPQGDLSTIVQGVWVASIPNLQSKPITKPLYADAGSGILFNLGREVFIGKTAVPSGVTVLPVNKIAESITLLPGSLIAGIRFHPTIGYGVFGRQYTEPTYLSREDKGNCHLYYLFDSLSQQTNNNGRMTTLLHWSEEYINSGLVPVFIEKVLERIVRAEKLGPLEQYTGLSQRQTERLFNTWLGMTPKYFQRVLRVKETIGFLQRHHHTDLAHVAIEFGFSDQAHMTREFRSIARTTPGKI